MKRKELGEVLILMGGISFAIGVLFKILGQEFLFLPVAYWRFAMGCFALSIAISLQRLADKR